MGKLAVNLIASIFADLRYCTYIGTETIPRTLSHATSREDKQLCAVCIGSEWRKLQGCVSNRAQNFQHNHHILMLLNFQTNCKHYHFAANIVTQKENFYKSLSPTRGKSLRVKTKINKTEAFRGIVELSRLQNISNQAQQQTKEYVKLWKGRGSRQKFRKLPWGNEWKKKKNSQKVRGIYTRCVG